MIRSDPMTFTQIYMQPEAAFDTMTQIGDQCCCQFLDVNEHVAVPERKYVTEMCRCAEMERKLRYIQSEMEKDNIYYPYYTKVPKPLQQNETIPLENLIEKWSNDLIEMSANQAVLMKSFIELTELDYVLKEIGPIVGDSEVRDKFLAAFGTSELGRSGQLVVFTGVVSRKSCFSFERMVWRISHGNILYRLASEDITVMDPQYEQDVRKVAFIIICQGRELGARVEKICTGFRAALYPCPKTYEERKIMMDNLDDRLNDMDKVIKKTKYTRCKALRTIGDQWWNWMASIRKAKAIYHHLNLFSLDVTKNCLIGRCWTPAQDVLKIQNILVKCSKDANSTVGSFLITLESDEMPPTFYRVNKFTAGFQNLINAYGDGSYMELNPGYYTVITFPFLFAVMFGDMGHGLIMASFAAWMVINEKKFEAERTTNEIWNIFFKGRYVILLMGIFSIYTGFVYNDVFAKPLILTHSAWSNDFAWKDIIKSTAKTLPMDAKSGSPYIFGVDPAWRLHPHSNFGDKIIHPYCMYLNVFQVQKMSKNSIIFANSLKMKMSIILGVIHMIFGVVLSFFNHKYFKHDHAIFLEFIPQVVFLISLFLYLVFMMFFKWFRFSMYNDDPGTSSTCAPQILIYFIDMVLLKTTKGPFDGCPGYMYPGQKLIQRVLLIIALICVPIMLFGSPVYVTFLKNPKRLKNAFRTRHMSKRLTKQSAKDTKVRKPNPLGKPPFSELMITQGVHTIEFVLSTVSHTASYLRLWALSLAHSQLSDMLWQMIMAKLALQDHSRLGAVRLFGIFAVWATFTVSIMVLMEGLSAFLHTLRLHWVEFMSKFFIGGGVRFAPFCFKTILSFDEDDDKTYSTCTKIAKSKG